MKEDSQIQVFERAANRLAHLLESIEITESTAFADGGTICLRGGIGEGVDLRICLSPADSAVFMGRPGELRVIELDKTRRQQTVHKVAARSELEVQIIALLKSARCRNVELEGIRDKIIAFVESERYLELHRDADVIRRND